TKAKLSKQAQKEIEIKKLFELLKSSTPQQTPTPHPVYKKKLPKPIEPVKTKEEHPTEILKKELINMFEAQPLKDLSTKIRSELIARESDANKEILNTNTALLYEKAKEEERISNWTQKIYSSIQKEQKAKDEKGKQKIVDLFLSSPTEGLKEQIRAEIISRESDHVKATLAISFDLPNERMQIEKRILNWTREIHSLIQKRQKSPERNLADKNFQNGETDTKALKKEIASLFVKSPGEGLKEQIRTEIISRESDRIKEILSIDPELLNKRMKIEKRISELTNELYSSVLLKKKSIVNPVNQISLVTEQPKTYPINKFESKDDKKKREIFELFISSTAKDLKEQIRMEIISRESDGVKELLGINPKLLANKTHLEKKISNLTKQIYEAVEQRQNENPHLRPQEPKNNQSNEKTVIKKTKTPVIIIKQEQLQEALGNKKTGNLRQLKKLMKQQIAQKGNS
ncbi:MAG: hypothetical protein WCF95_00280, partial [bacterium]